MKITSPSNRNTEVVDKHSWRVHDVECLKQEVSAIQANSESDANQQHVILYRGHGDSNWLLNSTFARSLLKSGVPMNYPVASEMFLDKFGSAVRPSEDLMKAAHDFPGIDPWFELMKRIQQHPEEMKHGPPEGTFLLDWSKQLDVGLCFACDLIDKEGCLYILDAHIAGNILIQAPIGEVLDRFRKQFANGENHGRPLMFCPSRQIAYERAKRQDPIYIAQMDLSVSLEDAWEACERADNKGKIFRRILIPPHVKQEILSELNTKRITMDWLLNR